MNAWELVELASKNPREYQRIRETMKPTRAEENRLHEIQDRYAFNPDWQRYYSVARNGLNPSVYLLLRFHPLNIHLPWIIWHLGSVVVV